MPSFATGRTRTASVTLSAYQTVAVGSVIDGSVGYNISTANAFGISIAAVAVVHDKGFDVDEEWVDPDPPPTTSRWYGRWYVTVEWTITVGGVEDLGTVTYTTGYSPFEIITELPPPGGGFGEWADTPGLISGTVTATWELAEYLDEDAILTSPYSELRGSVTAGASGYGEFTFDYQGHTIVVPFLYTESATLRSWDGELAGYPDQGAGCTFNCATGASNGLSVSLDGITWTASAFSLAAGDATFAGTAVSAAVSKTDDTTLATASVQATPDWAYSYDLENWDYETGDPVAVDTLHECGGTLVSASTGGHRYPASGVTGQFDATVSCDGDTDSAEGLETLGVCATGGGANYARVDETWADTHGRYLNQLNLKGSNPSGNPGLNAQYGILQSQDFDAGTFQVDTTHLFDLFETDAHFESDGSGTLGMSGGVLTHTNPSPSFPSAWYGYQPTENPTGYVLKPFGYRFYSFQMRGTAPGQRFRILLGRKLNGGGDTAQYYWDFTVGVAGVWETHLLDLCHPDAQFDDITFPLSPTTRRRIEPAMFQLFPDETVSQFIASDPGTLQLRSFTGYYKTTGNRTPALFIGPCSCGHSDMALMGLAPGVFDSCSGDTENGGKVAGGVLAFRLIANGACAFNLDCGTGKLDDAFAAWVTTYDDALNDTGLHFTTGISPYLAATVAESGWVVRRPLWSELTLGAPLTLRGVKRGFDYGYYGCGDIFSATYDPTLNFRGDKVWNGELLAAVHDTNRSQAGAVLELLDDDSSTVVASGVSDADGLIRLFAPYGAQQPFSNYPRADSCASRQEYTGTAAGGDVAYTTPGLLLNGYWIRGQRLRDSDGDDLATYWWSLDRFAVLDRYPQWREFDCDPEPLGAVDLVQCANGLWFRAWRQGPEIHLGRSADAGTTWQHLTLLFEDAALDPGSAPTLVVDQHDHLSCWVHGSDGAARLYRSVDYGAEWTLAATHASRSFPRIARQLRRSLLVAHVGTELRFYESTDGGVTLSLLSALTLTAPVQLAGLRVDRHDRLHVLYTDGADFLHRALRADDTWSAADTLTSGDSLAGYALGIERGAYLYWDTTLRHRQTDEVFAADAGALTGLTDIDTEAPLGVWWSHGELLYVCGYDEHTGELETRVSLDRGTSWVAA